MKITDYERVVKLKNSDIFLLDGENGTKTIDARNLALELQKQLSQRETLDHVKYYGSTFKIYSNDDPAMNNYWGDQSGGLRFYYDMVTKYPQNTTDNQVNGVLTKAFDGTQRWANLSQIAKLMSCYSYWSYWRAMNTYASRKTHNGITNRIWNQIRKNQHSELGVGDEIRINGHKYFVFGINTMSHISGAKPAPENEPNKPGWMPRGWNMIVHRPHVVIGVPIVDNLRASGIEMKPTGNANGSNGAINGYFYTNRWQNELPLLETIVNADFGAKHVFYQRNCISTALDSNGKETAFKDLFDRKLRLLSYHEARGHGGSLHHIQANGANYMFFNNLTARTPGISTYINADLYNIASGDCGHMVDSTHILGIQNDYEYHIDVNVVLRGWAIATIGPAHPDTDVDLPE